MSQSDELHQREIWLETIVTRLQSQAEQTLEYADEISGRLNISPPLDLRGQARGYLAAADVLKAEQTSIRAHRLALEKRGNVENEALDKEATDMVNGATVTRLPVREYMSEQLGDLDKEIDLAELEKWSKT